MMTERRPHRPTPARSGWLLPALGLGLLFALGSVGCRPVPPEASVEGVPQACCTEGDTELQNFAGCRIPTRKCRSRRGEKWWMRGSVHCGPVDEANCAGGRCCSYQPQYNPDLSEPIENWAPPGHDKPTNNVTDPDAPPQHDVPQPKDPSTEAAPPADAPPAEEATAEGEPPPDARP